MIKIRKTYYVIIVVTLLVLIGVGAYFLIKNHQNNQNINSTALAPKNGLVKSIDGNNIIITDINTKKDFTSIVNESTTYRTLNKDNQFEKSDKNALKVGSLIVISESQNNQSQTDQTIDILN